MSAYNSIGHMTAIFSSSEDTHANENQKTGLFAALRRKITKALDTSLLRRQLDSMTDYQLDDIGIDRSDIPALLNGTYVRPVEAPVSRDDVPKQTETIKHIGERPALAA